MLLLAEGRDRLSQWGRVFGGAPRAPGRTAAGLETGGAASAPVRTGRRIGVMALGIALVVPAALPSLDGGLLGGTGAGAGSGLGGGTISAVNPLVSLQDNLNQPEDREALRYKTNAESTENLYLRIMALDDFDGTSWRFSQRSVEDVPDRLPGPPGLGDGVSTTEIRTSISAASWYRQNYLPMPYPASEVDVEGRWRFEPNGRTLVGDRGETTQGAQYQVSSLLVEPTREQLAAAPRPAASLVREYTKVPEGLPGEVEATAREVTDGAANDYEKAVRLQDWFAVDGGFTYDTTVTSGTGVTAITRFLRDKQGFCVHFSFSMAAMARTLGIPARVAVGFTPGTPQSDGTMSVGLRDAHAWPELYFEGVGWTRFEPTPSRGSAPDYTIPEAPSGDASDPAQPEASTSSAPNSSPSASDSCPPQAARIGDCETTAPHGGAASDGLGAVRGDDHRHHAGRFGPAADSPPAPAVADPGPGPAARFRGPYGRRCHGACAGRVAGDRRHGLGPRHPSRRRADPSQDGGPDRAAGAAGGRGRRRRAPAGARRGAGAVRAGATARHGSRRRCPAGTRGPGRGGGPLDQTARASPAALLHSGDVGAVRALGRCHGPLGGAPPGAGPPVGGPVGGADPQAVPAAGLSRRDRTRSGGGGTRAAFGPRIPALVACPVVRPGAGGPGARTRGVRRGRGDTSEGRTLSAFAPHPYRPCPGRPHHFKLGSLWARTTRY